MTTTEIRAVNEKEARAAHLDELRANYGLNPGQTTRGRHISKAADNAAVNLRFQIAGLYNTAAVAEDAAGSAEQTAVMNGLMEAISLLQAAAHNLDCAAMYSRTL